MTISAKQLNRATLARQLLLQREKLEVADAVRHVLALQAQEAASPYLALWNRLVAFDPAGLDAAFSEQVVVKATLMRLTLHAVHAEDYPSFHSAMLPSLRASCLGDSRFTDSGLSIAEADALLPQLVEFAAQPRSRVEVEEMLEAQLGFRHKGVWWALRRFAPLWHACRAEPWSFDVRPSLQLQLQLLTRNQDRLATNLKAKRMALHSLPDGAVGEVMRTPHEGVVEALKAALKQIEAERFRLVTCLAPQRLGLYGVGTVLAATVVAEVGNIARFGSPQHFASFCGAAPVPQRAAGPRGGA